MIGKTKERLRSVRILIVDDDPETRAGLAVLCVQAGMEAEVAGSVSEARRAIDLCLPDAVISDLVMPDEDGFALLPTLCAKEDQLGHHIASVLMTGQSDPEIKRRALAAGFDAFLTKPYDSTTIVRTVNRLIAAGAPEQNSTKESSRCPKPRRALHRRAPREK
jgi:two-component system CheB/CheR fusion protein